MTMRSNRREGMLAECSTLLTSTGVGQHSILSLPELHLWQKLWCASDIQTVTDAVCLHELESDYCS